MLKGLKLVPFESCILRCRALWSEGFWNRVSMFRVLGFNPVGQIMPSVSSAYN